MTLTIVIGIASLLFLGAAVIGVIIDKEGRPSILIKSNLLRVFLGLAGSSLMALSVFMWNQELNNKDTTCQECEGKIKNLTDDLIKLRSDYAELQENLNAAVEQVYDDSSNFLIRVAKLIGKRSNLGCTLSIIHYQEVKGVNQSDQDICERLKLLMHPVTITAANGIDEVKLQRTLETKGIPTLVIPKGRRNNARSIYLGIFYPDSVSKDVICLVRNMYEKEFKDSNKSSKDISIRYALNTSKLGRIQKNKIVLSRFC